ncbi:hypothetical protein SRRS_35630 [Sporomusa rhizae]|uniref:GNAT family N-acetyltransferase n=1 Tax=Sporomusa rhizae TaxID=357999 RepID=UPI00352A0D33
MEKYELVSDYRCDEQLRESFNKLVINVLEGDFRNWYSRGYWNEKYIPYSFVDQGKVISNVSVSEMSIIIEGKKYKGIQISTVMTDENYRHQGLAKKLMNHIIEKYEDHCDFLYLFANDTVLDFYPKFGFERLDESDFFLDIVKSSIQPNSKAKIKKLSIDAEEDLKLMEKFALNRKPISTILGVESHDSLSMFHFTLVFEESIYYIEELETIVIMEEDKDILHIYDIITLNDQDIKLILESVINESMEKVQFYFTPDFKLEGMTSKVAPFDDDALFIRSKQPVIKGNFIFPLTSHY